MYMEADTSDKSLPGFVNKQFEGLLHLQRENIAGLTFGRGGISGYNNIVEHYVLRLNK